MEDPFTQPDLRLLTGLSKLQALTIKAPTEFLLEQDSEELQLAVQEFPGRLTALTKLQLSLETCHSLRSVGGCAALQDLQVRRFTTVLCHNFNCYL